MIRIIFKMPKDRQKAVGKVWDFTGARGIKDQQAMQKRNPNDYITSHAYIFYIF